VDLNRTIQDLKAERDVLAAAIECLERLAAGRGEVLALRWCDIRNDAAFVDRSLCQTRDGLTFKNTKTETSRRIELPRATGNARTSSAVSTARATGAIWT
jgi:hypothetical protein